VVLGDFVQEHKYREKIAEGGDMLPKLGPGELLIIFLIVLLLFGASRLRDVGGALGGAIRDFRSAVSGSDEEKGEGEGEEKEA